MQYIFLIKSAIILHNSNNNSNNNNFLVYLIHIKPHIDIALNFDNYLQIANETISCNN
jgi:hypothetical protein